MAIPAIPSNFQISQAAAPGFIRVLTTWQGVAGATNYSVQRSVDGINFTVVGTPTTNLFVDTSCTFGTTYYYNVASSNLSGTSPYTGNLKVVPTKMGQMSAWEIILRARQKVDAIGDSNVVHTELMAQANWAYAELYDILIKSSADYFVNNPRLTLTADPTPANQGQFFTLPDGLNYNGAPPFYKLYGADSGYNGDAYSWVTLRRFNFGERNRFVYQPGVAAMWYSVQYKILGNMLMINAPNSIPQIGIWYYPRLTPLLLDSDVVDGISGWEEYIVARVARYIQVKQESPTDALDAEIGMIRERIEAMAKDQDVGQPETVTDIRFQSGNGNGGIYGGGFGSLF